MQGLWGYAPDYIKAMWLMLQHKNPIDIAICSGHTNSLKEFVEIVFKKLDLNCEKYLKIDKKLYRPIDLDIIYGDNSKAKKEIGWQCDMTFEQLIDQLIDDEIKYIEWKERIKNG